MLKMRSICFCVFALAISVSARTLRFNDNHMPIRLVETSMGAGGEERIMSLHAEIRPHHVTTNQRVNFPTSGPLEKHFKKVKAPGDERGHLVASQFSGPPQWYNLSPQNSRVNRNLGYQSITTDWYGAECEVRQFLQHGGNRYVSWTVSMTYKGASNRPNDYHLRVKFVENGRETGRPIDARIHNPTKSQDSTFWICRTCRSNMHGHNGCTRG